MNPKHSQTQGPFSRRRHLVFGPIFFKKSSVAKYGCKSTSLATWAQTNDLFSVAKPSHFTHQRPHHRCNILEIKNCSRLADEGRAFSSLKLRTPLGIPHHWERRIVSCDPTWGDL